MGEERGLQKPVISGENTQAQSGSVCPESLRGSKWDLMTGQIRGSVQSIARLPFLGTGSLSRASWWPSESVCLNQSL